MADAPLPENWPDGIEVGIEHGVVNLYVDSELADYAIPLTAAEAVAVGGRLIGYAMTIALQRMTRRV